MFSATFFRLLLACVFLAVQPLLYSVLPTGTLQEEVLVLGTTVLAESEFTITGPTEMTIIPGVSRENNRNTYTFVANTEMSLTITSANASAGGTMRMQHIEVPEAYMTYRMYFDFSGLGALGETLVLQGAPVSMGGFDNGYDIAGTFSFETVDDELALEGDYRDTITFSFQAQ
jgi:hypothetical protein